ncbi:MAG: DUF2064 domain-containing protein [Planctomycetota bacterium]|nr:DUF2064 domain-containing protein [Planctomycetota bacterium]MDA1212975.1 DUF2064 domain-containing protein [Planctomycetota bacterium]
MSVVIPVGPDETGWRRLLMQIESWDFVPEVIVVFAEGDEANARGFPNSRHLRHISSPRGRALQLNAGAHVASHALLWFLHADSQVDANASRAMRNAVQRQPDAMYFLDLAFSDDGPPLMKLNAWGAKMRSRCLGMPFGDQGLCLSQRVFTHLGGYDTSAKYGEDHLLVWEANRQRVPVKRVAGTIVTSSRKYAEQGWLRTTCRHFIGTWKQALPAWIKTWRSGRKIVNDDSVAVVVFVKTPGLSPVKTRLAAEIGTDDAERCYRLSVHAVEAVVQETRETSRGRVVPYWAVAEPAGMTDPLWKNFDRLVQPVGGLGERLAGVYSQLAARHRGVIFLGADAPQLTPEVLNDAIARLNAGFPFVIGPATDGGFYLFGGSIPLPDTLWTSVEYSCERTCEQLCRNLTERGPIVTLAPLRDIDQRADLDAVVAEINAANPQPGGVWLSEQKEFGNAFRSRGKN